MKRAYLGNAKIELLLFFFSNYFLILFFLLFRLSPSKMIFERVKDALDTHLMLSSPSHLLRAKPMLSLSDAEAEAKRSDIRTLWTVLVNENVHVSCLLLKEWLKALPEV